ncbi:hypothetical protein GGC64_006361 [Mycobacterium sp. OAS707]|uniref:hypothetical protein n=1 Tax=Mycobacterium sp. OAS707 TaxID=2663822 RepID=UPI00178B3CD5|nr:hypothetical protein [Mycobacterium sp. OAS707]MBE1552274.1 hypothetical protein [Mycobacterium sp. OAS707]
MSPLDSGQAVGRPLYGHMAAVFGVVFSPDHRSPVGDPLSGHRLAIRGVHHAAAASESTAARYWRFDGAA